MTLPLETGIIYGLLFSRRLGLSLGLNVLPVNVKVCSFDCIYCHYGLTNRNAVITDTDFPSLEKVCGDVEQALRSSIKFDTLTFSGNGEPTLHPHFTEIVTEVRKLRDNLRPDVTLSIYSNASTVGRSQLSTVWRYFDNPILKMDVGDQQTFELVNRPICETRLRDIITGLKRVPNLIIQSLIVGGPVNNSHSQAIKVWQTVLAEINPVKVQLYSCDYPVPVKSVERVLPYVLKRIAQETESILGVPVEPFWIT